MMISQTAEYALRAVTWLAGHPDRPLGTPQISMAARVPSGYLAKVMQMLARADLVVSAPGRNGGFRLTRDPATISVLDVINAVDPIGRIRSCPLELAGHGEHLCPLHRRLDDAMAQVEFAFANSTIAELLGEPGGPRPLAGE
ncbi:MAG TPA: Rrf2 family transcriptional regulator [Candidatus Krumholzibacteria bacterium]|nr:Rrf2 family transcriptional regulator [Candidatus Krumholzibacteria bacterium]HPD70152.1 Rrf2 family transcriptional regulator [Candidatus Krumholzibacteria bacterium]HRY40148.1 Rrf2 family transcriptional regulator [Candidatus Krumholzibacteria bacterium]